MSGTQTIINLLTSDQFRKRIVSNIPHGWAGSDAMATGNWSFLLRALGGEMNKVQSSIQYTQTAMRLTTETSPELDLASQDFFGSTLPRPAGMSDTAFASLIISNLFQNAATRPAIAAALQNLTGYTPRLLEPWNIFDTGVWDRISYWDVDTAANPARWGTNLAADFYDGYVETPAPSVPLIGPNVPILGWDTTAFWDHPGYFFADLQSNTGQNVDALVNRMRALGVTAWVKIVNPPVAGTVVLPGATLGLIASVQNSGSVMLTWTPPVSGTKPFSYQVQYRVTGTTTWQIGPVTLVPSAIVSGLAANTEYDFQVFTFNSAGPGLPTSIAQATTVRQPPAPVTNLTATLVQATAVTLAWSPPASGTPPFTYTILYRVLGTTPFNQFSVGAGATAVTVIGLQPSTTYQFEVQTSN